MKKIYLVLILFLFASCVHQVSRSEVYSRQAWNKLTDLEISQLLSQKSNPDALSRLGDHFAGPDHDNMGGASLYFDALKINPDHVQANYGAGEYYLHIYWYQKAVLHFEKVARFANKNSPEHIRANMVLKYLKQEMSKK